jgi:hypothetical protein
MGGQWEQRFMLGTLKRSSDKFLRRLAPTGCWETADPRVRDGASATATTCFVRGLYRVRGLRPKLSGHAFRLPKLACARENDRGMTAPTVEAAIHELMDLAWNVVYDLLEQRGPIGDEFFAEDNTGIHSLGGRPNPLNGRPLPRGRRPVHRHQTSRRDLLPPRPLGCRRSCQLVRGATVTTWPREAAPDSDRSCR